MLGTTYVGQAMCYALKANEKIEDPIAIEAHDSDIVKALKELALLMTKPKAEDRPTMDDVDMKLMQIQGMDYFKN